MIPCYINNMRKQIIFLTVFSLLIMQNTNADSLFEDNFQEPGQWKFISDNVMGGLSTGSIAYEMKEGQSIAYLSGDVTTENNGGFIQLRSTLSFMSLNNLEKILSGVRIKTKGNGETYHIFIRTSKTRSYRDFYYATFIANEDWETVDLPFINFKHRFSDSALDGNDIQTFGIVAHGRDFYSDVPISEIIFYY